MGLEKYMEIKKQDESGESRKAEIEALKELRSYIVETYGETKEGEDSDEGASDEEPSQKVKKLEFRGKTR